MKVKIQTRVEILIHNKKDGFKKPEPVRVPGNREEEEK